MIQKKGKMILTVYWWKLPKQFLFLFKHRWTLHFSQKIKENPLQPGILHRCLVLLQFGMWPKLSVLTSFGGIAVEDDFFFFCSNFGQVKKMAFPSSLNNSAQRCTDNWRFQHEIFPLTLWLCFLFANPSSDREEPCVDDGNVNRTIFWFLLGFCNALKYYPKDPLRPYVCYILTLSLNMVLPHDFSLFYQTFSLLELEKIPCM